MPRVLVFVLVLFISGCVLSAGSNTKAFITACSAYSTALSSLAGYRAAGKLSDAQVSTVDRLRPGLNKVCSGPPDVSAATLRVVEVGLGELLTIKGTVQ